MFSKETYEFTPVYVMAMFEYMQQQFDIIKWQNAVIMRALLRQGIITDEDDLAIRNMFLSRDSNKESAVNVTRAFSGTAANFEKCEFKTIMCEKIVENAECGLYSEEISVKTVNNDFCVAASEKNVAAENNNLEKSSGKKNGRKRITNTSYNEGEDFRISSKQLYLTYPQSGELTRERVIESITEICGQLDKYIICLEQHEDGHPHIHAYFKLDKKFEYRGTCRVFDVDGYHGNYQTVIRSLEDVINYVAKDKDYISHNLDVDFYVSKYGRKRNGVRMQIATDIIDNNKSIYEVVKSYKTPIFGFSNLSRDIALYRDAKTDAELIHRPLREFKLFDLTFTFEGRHKEKQFWIVGPTNTGKTTMIESFMNDGYLAYKMPPNEKNFVGWHNKYSYCYTTEYYGSYTIGFYNTFLEGGSGDGWKMPIEVKFGSVEKTINVPVFTESNLYPHEVYKNATRTQIDALMSRLNIIEVFPNVVGPGWKSARILPPNEYYKTLNKIYIERAELTNSKYYK